MKSRFLAVPFLAATLSGLGSGATQAAPAVDAQVYTGAECVRYSGSSLGKVGSSAYYYNDSSTSAVNVICPMVRHHTGNGVDYGFLTYSDRNHASGQRVSCRLLRHARSNGAWVGIWSGVHYSQNLDPGSMYFHDISDAAGTGAYYFRCAIPPRDPGTGATSFISRYTLVEFE